MECKDTDMALTSFGQLGVAYHNLGKKDSALYYFEETSRRYLEFGDTLSANTELGAAAYIYLA